MSGKIEFESLIQPPEFELRCDSFIHEVQRVVVPEYPELGIYPENSTKEDLEKFPEMVKFFQEILKLKENQIQKQVELDQLTERLSSIENSAEVQIWGWDGKTSRPHIRKAIKTIERMAMKHRGRKWHTEDEVNESIDNVDLPNAWLSYTFLSKDIEELIE